MRQKISLIIAGTFAAIFLLEISLRLSGWIFSSLQEYRGVSSVRQKGAYRIMCLGESTTALGGKDSYPSQLEEILNQRNPGIHFSVINKGRPVVNTTYILAHLEENLNQCRPDMVIAMMGSNDIYVKYYEDIPEACGILFNKSSAYRFFRLLWMNTLNKIRKTGIYKPEQKAEEALFPEALKDASETSPGNGLAHMESGMHYRNRGKLSLAEEEFKKAITLDPKNDTAYVWPGIVYRDQRKFLRAEEAFKRATELSSRKDKAYIQLGKFYRDHFRKPDQAEQAFKKAIELNPQDDEAYVELGRCFTYYGKYAQAEEALKKAFELNPVKHRVYRGLALLYSEMGKEKLADEYYGIVDSLKYGYYGLTTNRNYQELKMILDKRGIKLVCAQYPMRSLQPLKMMLQGQPGAIFVDNEKVFKEALKKGSFKDYFIDMFAGDFGHCTPRGNRLLAENIADTILKDYFKK